MDSLSKLNEHYVIKQDIFNEKHLGIGFAFNDLELRIEHAFFSSLDDLKDNNQT